MKRGRRPTDVRLNELANELRGVKLVDTEHALYDYRDNCFRMGDRWHYVYLGRDGNVWNVRFTFRGKHATVGLTEELSVALVFADLANERFRKYRFNAGIAANNLPEDIMQTVRDDNEGPFEEMERVIDKIEEYLLSIEMICKGDPMVPRKPRRTVRDEILTDFSHIKKRVGRIEDVLDRLESLIVCMATHLKVPIPDAAKSQTAEIEAPKTKEAAQARIDEIIALGDDVSLIELEEMKRLTYLIRGA